MNQHSAQESPTENAPDFQSAFNEAAAPQEPSQAPAPNQPSQNQPGPNQRDTTGGIDLESQLSRERAERERLEVLLARERKAVQAPSDSQESRDPAPDARKNNKQDITSEDERLLKEFFTRNPKLEAPLRALVRQETIKAVRPLADVLMGELHIQRIAQAHPDWNTLAESDELKGWIDEQPAYIAKSLHHIVRNGQADDVIELLTSFKQAVAKAKSAPNATAETDTDMAMAVPARSSGLPKATPDADDFRGAWREALACKDD